MEGSVPAQDPLRGALSPRKRTRPPGEQGAGQVVRPLPHLQEPKSEQHSLPTTGTASFMECSRMLPPNVVSVN